MKIHLRAFFPFLIIGLFCGNPASALLLEVIAVVGGGSALIDRAGKRADDAINEAEQAALSVLDRGAAIGNEMLDRVETLERQVLQDFLRALSESEEAAIRVLDEGVSQADQLKDEFFAQALSLLKNAECSVQRTLIEQVRYLLGDAGSLINASEVVLESPAGRKSWGRVVSQSFSLIPATDAYAEVATFYQEEFSYSDDESSINQMLKAHGLLERLAERAACDEGGDSIRYLREASRHRRIAASINHYFAVPLLE